MLYNMTVVIIRPSRRFAFLRRLFFCAHNADRCILPTIDVGFFKFLAERRSDDSECALDYVSAAASE